MAGWNLADVWELVAEVRPDQPALVHAGQTRTWGEVEQRSSALGSAMAGSVSGRQAKVALYLYNGNEYLEAFAGTLKAGLVPVNTNYRYREEELAYLWSNADAEVVVFHGCFVPRVEAVRGRVPGVRRWLWVDDGTEPCPSWAEPYEQVASRGPLAGWRPAWGRSADDLVLIYTGGTTGMPKGVMWRQDDLYQLLAQTIGDPPQLDPGHVRRRLESTPGQVGLPACPLMHGTGILIAVSTWITGGTVVTLASRRLDIEELLDTVERERVERLAIVGDAFARPMLDALEAGPDRWDLSSLDAIISSGAMWSQPVKDRLTRHLPRTLLVDMLGASEAVGMGQSISSARRTSTTASFRLGDRARVLTDDGRDVQPGSGGVGMLAVGGPMPVGYYKDPEKTDLVFRVVDGVRWSFPGDFATVEEDGSLRLLGRGSVCINTGGEKVFPEEVEEVAKTHPAVADAIVVGVPDDRLGEAICAVVEPRAGASVGRDDVVSYVKERLAGYKAPRHVLVVETVGRAPNGKADYPRWRKEAAASLDSS